MEAVEVEVAAVGVVERQAVVQTGWGSVLTLLLPPLPLQPPLLLPLSRSTGQQEGVKVNYNRLPLPPLTTRSPAFSARQTPLSLLQPSPTPYLASSDPPTFPPNNSHLNPHHQHINPLTPRRHSRPGQARVSSRATTNSRLRVPMASNARRLNR